MTDNLNQIQIFETRDGQINLEVRLQDDTVWLSTEQMSMLFARERSVLTKHINNVFKEAELEKNGNVQNLHIAHSDKPIKGLRSNGMEITVTTKHFSQRPIPRRAKNWP